MLTSSANQYLRPDYLSPLPSTLDTNKSPLVLLAKTCSSIGQDSPNNKLLILSDTKKSDHNNHGSGGSSGSGSSGCSDRKKSNGSGGGGGSGSSTSSSVHSLVNGLNTDDNNSNNSLSNHTINASTMTTTARTPTPSGMSSSSASLSAAKLSFKPYDISSNNSNNSNNKKTTNNNNYLINSDYNNINDLMIGGGGGGGKRTPNSYMKVSGSPKSVGSNHSRSSPLNNNNNSGTGSGKNTPLNNNNHMDGGHHHKNGGHHMQHKQHESHSPKSTSSSTNGTPNGGTKRRTPTPTSSALSYTSIGMPDMRLDGIGKHKEPLQSLQQMYKTNPYSSSNCCPPSINGLPPPLTVDKTGAYPSIYPPLSVYGRMKVANSVGGGQPMMPMCSDPYCTGTCQLSALQNAALLASAAAAAANTCSPATCPNGCNQCDHQRLMSSLAYPKLNPALLPSLSQMYPSLYHPGLAAVAAAQQQQQQHHHHHQQQQKQQQQQHQHHHQSNTNVCNWIAGDQHCGKRFQTSEELLNHLRTHTSASTGSVDSSSSSAITTVPSMIPSLGLSSSSASSLSSSLAQHMHYSTAGALQVPTPTSLTSAAGGGLRRTYPTSLSPLSSRFHPYKPTVIHGLGSMPSIAAGVPQLGGGVGGGNPLQHSSASAAAALSMYYPYGLYSGRIGPPVHP